MNIFILKYSQSGLRMLKTFILSIIVWLIFYFPEFAQEPVTGKEYQSSPMPSIEYLYATADSIRNNLNNDRFLIVSVGSIYREIISNLKADVQVNGRNFPININKEGIFVIYPDDDQKGQLIDLTLSHSEFQSYDTSFIFTDDFGNVLQIRMLPKYAILLKGRVYAGNLPLEGVDVKVRHNSNTFNLSTLGCYTDSEDYWNCLYLGMFKQEITTDNPEDDISIWFSKQGFKEKSYSLKFKEYDGDILNVKMKYASELPYFPSNNFSLKIGFPLNRFNDWFINFGYHRLLTINNFERLGVGAEICALVTNVSVSHVTFPGLQNSVTDSSYISTLLGPTALLYITKPTNRHYSFYTGINTSIILNNGSFSFQPFVGGKHYLDLNKALILEIRYMNYAVDVTNYRFNPYGNAEPYQISKEFQNLLINFGLNVSF